MQLIDTGSPLPPDALTWTNTTDPMNQAQAVKGARVIALEFPKWTDGRAYSQAVLLRARLRYTGEIRATGEVLVDMLPLLRRCGFDTAQLRGDQSADAAQRALSYFPGHYQGDASGAAPRFSATAS